MTVTRYRRRPRRLLLGVTFALLTTAAAASPASAQGACSLRVDGGLVLPDAGPESAIEVRADQVVMLEGTAPRDGDPYRVWIDYFGIPVVLSQGAITATWSTPVDLAQYSWVGAGLYRVVGETSGEEPCTTVVYIRVAGTSPLTVASGLGAAVSLGGGLLFLRSLGRSGRRIRRRAAQSPEEPGPSPERPPQPEAAPTPQSRRLARLNELAERARAAPIGPPDSFATKSVLTAPIALADTPDGDDVYELVLVHPPGPVERTELAALGVDVIGHLPPATYRTVLGPAQLAHVDQLPFVREVRRFGMDRTIGAETVESLLADDEAGEQLRIDCFLHRSKDLDVVRVVVNGAPDLAVLEVGRDAIRLAGPASSPSLAALAALPQVRRMTIYRAPALLCDRARALMGIDAAARPRPPTVPDGWSGGGETVAILDSGVDDGHPDLAGRFVAVTSVDGASAVDIVGHGTHVAGIVGGSGAASGGVIRGMAPGAHLVSIGIVRGGTLLLPVDLGDLLVVAIEHGATIVNLSWGTPIAGDYDSGSFSVDRFALEHPDVLLVVAAGNSGVAPDGQHRFRTVGTPASAKNVLTVGASATDRPDFADVRWGDFRETSFPRPAAANEPVAGDPDLPAAISSRGPTDFDSVKPDLVAPGTFILSTRASNTDPALPWQVSADHGGRYFYCGGTSMAAPMVAGAAAVVRQYLRSRSGGSPAQPPSAALLKAVLVAAARRLPSGRAASGGQDYGYPDFDQGFGRLDLAVLFDDDGTPVPLEVVDVANDSAGALEARAEPGSGRVAVATYQVEVGPDRPLRVVLAWTDRPGVYVQNNLQLEVRGPGVVVAGNGEHRYLRDAAIEDPTGRGVVFDKRNTVEQVVIEQPAQGRYQVRVVAQNTPLPPQGYGLCVTGDLESTMELE